MEIEAMPNPYNIKYVSHGKVNYAVATNSDGKYGVLTGYETVNIDTADIDFVICGEACPFLYDNILVLDCGYIREGYTNGFEQFDIFLLCISNKRGVFSTLYGSVILKPVPKDKYCILDRATTEGLVGCIRNEPNKPGFSRYTHVFLNCEGEEVITLDKGWSISRGFQDEEALISSGYYDAIIDKKGEIKKKEKRDTPSFEDDPYEIDKMYRDAFEGDPGAEWNIN